MKINKLGFCYFVFLVPALFLCFDSYALKVGASAVDITPKFEGRPQITDRPSYKKGDPFYDTGTDLKFDYEEDGAFGPDEAPGQQGVDDDRNGLIDDCSRASCSEYRAQASDDRLDPAHDNYSAQSNPRGTEGDGKYQWLYIAGFDEFFPLVSQQANRFATAIHDPLWARALAIEDSSGTKLVMISVDSPGILWKVINPIRRKIARDLGVPYKNIIVSATHSHYAPDPAGFWWSLSPKLGRHYVEQLSDGVVQAAREAWTTRRLAKVKSVTAHHASCVDRRTGELKYDPDCKIPMIRSDVNGPRKAEWDDGVIQADVRDPIVRVPTLVAAQFVTMDEAMNEPAGRTIATWINYHSHPDTLLGDVQEVSSDFPHYLRQYIESHFGGTAVYFSGAIGCQIGSHPGVAAPLWTESMEPVVGDGAVRTLVRDNSWTRVRSIGYELAHEVEQALLKETQWDSQGSLKVKSDQIDIPIENFLHANVTTPAWEDGVEPQDHLIHDQDRCSNRRGCVRSDMSLIELGSLSVLTVPGELDPSYWVGRKESEGDYGTFGKKLFPAMVGVEPLMPGTHHMLMGLSQNFLAYFFPLSDNVGWRNTKHPVYYEEKVTVSQHSGDDIGNKLMQMLGSQLRYSSRPIKEIDR